MKIFSCKSLLASLLLLFSSMAWSLPQAIPTDSPDANIKGVFGTVFNWPVVPIHTTLLPDGRVLSFGTDQAGVQGAKLVHALWDFTQGIGSESHSVLANNVSTDMFCAGQAMISSTGETLITGGDNTIAGKRNYSNADTNFFNYKTGLLTPGASMSYKRWYTTLVGLANGDVLILGGRTEKDIPSFASTPEVYAPKTGLRTLAGAVNEEAYGSIASSWFYPRAFQAPNGQVFILTNSGKMFYLNPANTGAITLATPQKSAPGGVSFPAVMYAPGKILSLRLGGKAIVVNLNGSTPTLQNTSPLSQTRFWSNATVLADGTVLVTGGSSKANELVDVAYHVELWNPTTGQWTHGANAKKPRLYHSTALLLPDATVLTGGGGAPGPVLNLNSEIYYPPYLFEQNGSSKPADRPAVVTAPDNVIWNHHYSINFEKAKTIKRVTLVRSGSSTHSFNSDQRFIPLKFTQPTTNKLNILTPLNPNIAPPGYYMLFIFNEVGTPSVAKIIHLE